MVGEHEAANRFVEARHVLRGIPSISFGPFLEERLLRIGEEVRQGESHFGLLVYSIGHLTRSKIDPKGPLENQARF